MNGIIHGLATRPAAAAVLLAATLLGAASAQAGTPGVTVLHAFGYQPDGEYPEARLVQGSNGTLYGTTYEGGVNGYGMAFSIASDGSGFTTLHSFTGADGEQLDVGMIFGNDGNLYGTTPQGSACNGSNCVGFGGSIFKLTTTGTLSTAHYFQGDGTPDGNLPGDLTDGGDGYFYGTTGAGGAVAASGLGTVFRISVATGKLTTLHSFTAAEPYFPQPGLTKGADGNFYGAAQAGPGGPYGELFKITPAGVVSTVHNFNGIDGQIPDGRLLLSSDGNFYGTTTIGGPNNGGTVFKLTPGGVLTTLYSFNGSDGYGPTGLVQTADGTLYGVTSGGGDTNYGTIFKISKTGVLTTLHLFEFADGIQPAAGPILGSDGLIYGTTAQGGAGGTDHFPTGTVYRFDPTAVQPPVLGMDKYCYNEEDECLPPFDTAVGGYIAIGWFSANVSACVASGAWQGAQPTGGYLKFQAQAPGHFTYRLSCRGANGPVTSSVTFNVVR